MPKYNFQDLHSRPRSQTLPADVNETAEALCKRVGDETALRELQLVREKRFYEEIPVYEPVNGGYRLKAYIFVADGMAERWYLCDYGNDGRLNYKRSILNIKLDKSKRRKDGNGREAQQRETSSTRA